jgi:2-polyprenyl-3-methyl-5-hydroxy-6-metoxy-1,4-benzoquinol methylase
LKIPRSLRGGSVVASEAEKEEEREEHNKTYGSLAAAQLGARTPADYIREVATPCFEDDSVLAGDVNALFLKRVDEVLATHDPATVRILDYGCGMGKLSVYLAQRGFKHIEGFDLADEGVAFGNRLAEVNGVAEAINLQQMDAENLRYDDASFDVVIGKAVLHHTIKYPKTADELHRVMRPGAVAIFKENIGNSPFMKLGRFVTMDLRGHHGDVNITTPMLQDYGRAFSSTHVEAMSFLFMAKRILWRPGHQPTWKKRVMKALLTIDDATVHRSDRLRTALGGEAVLTLVK